MGSNGITVLVSEHYCWNFHIMHSIMVGEVNLYKEELSSKPARSLLSYYLVTNLLSNY